MKIILGFSLVLLGSFALAQEIPPGEPLDPTLQPSLTSPAIQQPSSAKPPSDPFPWSGSSASSNLTPDTVTETPAAVTTESTFKKPPAPQKGGTVMAPHPNVPKGLMRINEDGTYQYKTEKITKTHSFSLKAGPATPPTIQGPTSNITFEKMYGSGNFTTVNLDYEWQAFRKFGSLGLQLGGGVNVLNGNGFLRNSGYPSMEAFTLIMVPVNAFVIYRFEYFKGQWIVPYVQGGGAMVGLVERRDDGKPNNYALAPSAGGAAGVHMSLSRLDSQSMFQLGQDYGVADLWFTVEGRIMQGLRSDVNYSTKMLTAGVTMDF